jgi:hypothetical protein
MDKPKTKCWDGFKSFLRNYFPAKDQKLAYAAWWGNDFIPDVRTVDSVLADKMQKVSDSYTEMYAYVAAKQNDNKENKS